MEFKAYNTAIARTRPSRPLTNTIKYLSENSKVLDYGCGRGSDADFLIKNKISCTKYDPFFYPKEIIGKFDVVLLTYVLNVIKKDSREIALRLAWKHVKDNGYLSVTVRNKKELDAAQKNKKWQAYEDGWITNKQRGTFQKGFTVDELEELILKLEDIEEIDFYEKNNFLQVFIKKNIRSNRSNENT